MYTRLKPQRVKTSNTPTPGQWLWYIDPENFQWQNIVWDMQYADFEWVTKTWSTITIEDISNNYTPVGNFTVQAGTVKPGIEYILRVNVGNVPYTMTLWTWVINPNAYDTNLKENTIHLFKFIATNTNQLEFEWVDTSNFVTLNTAQTITALKQFTVEPTLPSKSSAAWNNSTKPATEAQVYNVDINSVKLTGNQIVNWEKTFTTSPVVPAKNTDADSTKTTVIATEAQVAKKANHATPATANNLASLTATWDLTDSGIAKTSVELNTNKETWDAPTDSTSLYPSSHTVKKYVDDQVAEATAGAVSDAAYSSWWNGVTAIAPSKNAVYDKINTIDTSISTIEWKIPSEASTSNQLADKAFVNSSINSVTAYYITKNASWDQFATYAELSAATTFYSGWVVRVPTRNDYCIVQNDETHDHATTRYIYNNGWEYQYTVNETALTQAQLDAINSGITANKVATYDGYAALIAGKQDALANQTAFTAKGSATKVPQITTNSLGQVTVITEVDITHPVASATTRGIIKLWSNTVQTIAPNAVSSEWSRTYAIQVNSDWQAVVNVPWNDTIQAVDSALDITSLNPVQNKVITNALADKIDYPSWWTVWQALKKTANWAEWWDISWLPTGWTNWQIIMMVNWTPTWVTPTAKWFKMLSPNSPLSVPYDWYGTESQYSSATKDNSTEYRTV